MKEIDEEAFAADVREGLSTNALAKKYGIAWPDAKARRAQVQTPPSADAETTDDEETQAFTLKIDVPAEGIEALLRGISHTELLEAVLQCDKVDQANVLQAVVQRRMDKLFEEQEPPAIAMPALRLIGEAANG